MTATDRHEWAARGMTPRGRCKRCGKQRGLCKVERYCIYCHRASGIG